MSSPALTYSSYLKLDTLLSTQCPRSGDGDDFEHDEMLFIVMHQVYEIWFKEMLHELDYLMELLRANKPAAALHTFRRLLAILKTIVAQVDVLETMTPLEFSSFRSFLETASGFQSVQFRALEFALGHKRRAMLNHFPEDVWGRDDLEQRYHAPTLWDAFLQYIHINGYAVPADCLHRDVTQPIQPSPALQTTLIDIYRNAPVLLRICERLVDMDEGLQEWRYRHVKMVARTIGNKKGTGGSAGVDYLRTTITPLFPDLWAIRTEL